MTLTITGAAYANEDNSAVVIITVERGAVAISEQDRPEEWRQFLLWQKAGGIAEPFTLPTATALAPPPLSLAERKLRAFLQHHRDVLALLQAKGLSPSELGL